MAEYHHAVRFYQDSESLCRIVGEFVGKGLEGGDPAVIIATPDHRTLIDTCLRERGLDVDMLKRLGDLVVLDARDVLGTFMVSDMPDPEAFRYNVGQIISQVRRGRATCTVYTYGEMVDVLWRDGLEAAAIRLEMLWNELANDLRFKLVCGYSMGNFYKEAAVDEITALHSHRIDDDGSADKVA
jgi:hypothetical protein